MGVPFRVLPCALPGLELADFVEELSPLLRRDTILLDGGARAVEASAWGGGRARAHVRPANPSAAP